MVDGEGTGEGTQTGAGTGQQQPAWLAQLPADLKANEALTKYPSIGDLGKSHLEILGKVKELDGISARAKELEGKLANSIPKLGEKATPQEVDAYYQALGRPEKPEDYDLPKDDRFNEENKPFTDWMRQTFHKNGLTRIQGLNMATEVAGLLKGIEEAETEFEEKERQENEKAFRDKFKSEEEYKAGYELAKRFWKKMTNTEFDEVYKDPEAWKVPLIMNLIFETAKAVGEDFTPGSRPSSERKESWRDFYANPTKTGG